jgi:cytochrome P450
MNIHSVKKLLKKIYRKLKPIKPKTVDIKIDPAFELKTYLEQTDISDLKKIEDYAFLQSHGPMHFFPKNNAWLVTGYDEITHVLKNHEIFSEVELYRIMGKTDALFDINNSEYENLRNLIRNYFSNSFFKLLEEQLRKNIKSLTENILKKDKVDFIKEFSHIVTSETIRYIFGIDKSLIVDDSNEYKFFYDINNSTFFENLYTQESNLEDDKFAFHIKNLIAKNQLSIEEASIISNIIWFGGIDGTRSLIARMMYELITNPTVAENINDNKVLQIKFIEECFRLYPSIHKIIRVSKTDTTINNTFIAKGSKMYLDVYTANRDKNKFEQPNHISLEENKCRHISFGYGVAQCIGMGLARLEAKIAIEYVLEILPYATLNNFKIEKYNNEQVWVETFEILSLNINK